MIINLSNDLDEVLDALNGLDQREKIIDFWGILTDTFSSVIQPRDFDLGNEIELRALQHYRNFCGDVSRANFAKKPIRSFIISEVPLYWLTDLSEKHDSFHWGQSVFFMRQVLVERKDLYENEKKITVILPNKFKSATTLIENVIQDEIQRDCKVIYTRKKRSGYSSNFFIAMLINMFQSLLLKYKLTKVTGSVVEPENIFVAKLDFERNGQARRDLYLESIFEYGNQKKKSAYFPFVRNSNIKTLPFDRCDQAFANAYPSAMQVLQVYGKVVWVYCLLKIRKVSLVKINGLQFSDALIEYEFERALWKFNYIINYLWLKNYFDRKTKISVFFIEEFYCYGRMVSLAIEKSKNKVITSYGIQHGLLLRNHTVYTVDDKELQPDDAGYSGVPMPGKFIVWGNYFKTFFLGYNSLPNDYVIVAGNIKYIQLFVKDDIQRTINNDLKILWCTSLPSHFKAEYQKIRSVLAQRSDYTITFRMHPAGHIKQNNLLEWIDEPVKERSRFSTESDIFKDMANHDLIICTVFSATFFDSLVLNKNTCRMISNIAFPDFTNLKLRNLYDVYTTEDFLNVMDRLVSNAESNKGALDIRELCKFDIENWDEVLFNN